MKPTVLITGIGGSIGAHVLAYILDNTDWDIVGIDSFRHKGLTDRIYEVLKYRLPEERVRIFTHDLTAPISEHLVWAIGNVDYIINLASNSDVEASLKDPEGFMFNNVQLMSTMLEYSRKHLPNLKAFVQFSTDEVYGPSGPDGAHKEWSPILPSNPYAASKAMQEDMAIAAWRSFNLPLIITNTMNNFGEMQQPAKFPAMVQSKVEKGEEVTIHGTEGDIGSRYYIHSRNTADAVLFLLKNTIPYLHIAGYIDRPDRFNIVGDRRINNLEFATLIAHLMDKNLIYRLVDFHHTRPGHDKHYGLDGTKLRELGWVSPVSFEDSLKHTIEWQKNHPDWLR